MREIAKKMAGWILLAAVVLLANNAMAQTTKDIPYFITAPTFETSSEKYAWLNSVQLVNKMVELKLGEGGYVKYDVYVLR